MSCLSFVAVDCNYFSDCLTRVLVVQIDVKSCQKQQKPVDNQTISRDGQTVIPATVIFSVQFELQQGLLCCRNSDHTIRVCEHRSESQHDYDTIFKICFQRPYLVSSTQTSTPSAQSMVRASWIIVTLYGTSRSTFTHWSGLASVMLQVVN